MPPATRVFANRYEVGEEIGRGGMAEVFLAHDRLLDRQVAVKVLSSQFASDPTNVERFRREARAAAGLNHPHIVSVYDWGEEGDTSFIVMEYVPGETLRDIMHEYGRFAPTDAAAIVAEIADALQFAHAHGVVHRDVKPGNVLVMPQGQVKVTDFGIARAETTTEPLTKTGAVLGTATYFSPEQAQGFALDGRSDVYALGVVLYEMITGEAPFTASSPVSVAYKHVREQPVPPSSIVPDIPGAMDRIVLTAMAKDLDARYQSAQDLRADLMRFERGRPLVGGPRPVEPATAPHSVFVAAPVEVPAPVAAAPLAHTTPASARGRNGRWGPAAAIGAAIVVLVALIIVLIANSDFGDADKSAARVPVPNVVGTAYPQAAQALQDRKFEVRRVDDPAPDQPPDLVLAQDPEEGTKAVQGGKVTLRVSAASIAMPNVVGQQRDQATATLATSNLTANVVEEDSQQPPGTVLRSDPAAGAPVAKLPLGGRPTVTVVVAREPAIPVPNVSSQDPNTAEQTLTAAGFRVTRVQVDSDTVPAGRVVGTDPSAGTPLPRNSDVKLLISSGPTMVPVPSTVNQPRATAEATLNGQLKFNVTVTFADGGPTKKGLVISQSPAGGEAPKGSVITIVVGQ